MSVTRPRVVVTHWVHPEVTAYLAGFCDAVIPSREEGAWPREKVAGLAADADGLIACMADSVDEAFLSGCRRLRVISATLKGYDNFDAEACSRHGVWLAVVPGTIIAPTAELAIGLIIGLMRKIPQGDALVREGGFAGWRPQLYGAALSGATVGIAGMGQLGQAIARRLAGFEAEIVYHDARPPGAAAGEPPPGSYRGLEQAAEASDVLVVALPLTSSTRHLIGPGLLGRMRPGAFLVNVGRGSVVDEEAVARALDSGRLGGYAADVFAMEDWLLPGRPPAIADRLRRHPRTLFTPHLGSAVDAVRRQMSLQAARQLQQALDGHPPDNAVNQPAPAR
ncbi:MAG TPA: NAD(P)-dependent oxidoreductase [Trebonia sp.]|jgi:phosphonate dehydrogenase|nr:NAD(P)-dependent oxidoreductase [Trebonia sp.]